jgi:hypothetical protein
VPYADDFDQAAASLDPIHNTAGAANNFADGGFAKLRDHPSRFRETWEAFNGEEQTPDESSGGNGVILGDVVEDFVKIETGGWRPRHLPSH